MEDNFATRLKGTILSFESVSNTTKSRDDLKTRASAEQHTSTDPKGYGYAGIYSSGAIPLAVYGSTSASTKYQ